MESLRELYQEVILDHNRKPRNFGKLDDANCCANGYNPLCGDELTLYVKLAGDTITGVRFSGKGCAISTASASLMTEALLGKTKTQAEALFEAVHAMLTDAKAPVTDIGKLQVLAGVHEFPARVKCATLAWHTLKSALCNQSATVSTE